MSSPLYRLRKMERRAQTIKGKAEDLMSDLMDFEESMELSPQAQVMRPSDWADNITANCDDLLEYLKIYIERFRDPRGRKQ